MRIGALSAKYESGGDPAAVSQDPNDAGGWSYGIYQFSSAAGKVQDFVRYLQEREQPWKNYGDILAVAGDPACDQSFADKWNEIGTVDPEGFAELQDDYVRPQYFDAGAEILLGQYGFDIAGRSGALKAVLWSNCVQHGPTYGAEVFQDAADLAGKDIAAMSDHDLIYYIYEVKLTDPAWSEGSPANRRGLFARWRNEREDALSMLGRCSD
jgi:hypothetical protein